MKTMTRLVVAAAAVIALGAVSSAQLALAKSAPLAVPGAIAVEEGHKLFLVGHAVGVQIYACSTIATGPAWTFVGPRADVFDDKGKLLMTHDAGPRWRAKDGSFAIGTVVGRAPVAGSIPWLLLATSTDEGDGRLSATTFIQRIATTGGLMPAAAQCTAGDVGEIAEVPYTADYAFWKASGS